jgi:hypothetical protein
VRLSFAAAVAAALASLAAVALAAGGDRPSNAPTIAVGETQTSDAAGVEFWRVDAAARDQLVLTLTFRGGTDSAVAACVLPPKYSDADAVAGNGSCSGDSSDPDRNAFSAASPRAPRDPNPFIYRVASSGRWLIAVYDVHCSLSARGNFDYPCAVPVSYALLVRVRKFTFVRLTVPPHARRGQTIIVRGSVGATSGGTVQIAGRVRLFARVGLRQRVLATLRVAASGAFSARVRLTRRGSTVVNAVYTGTPTFQRAEASRTITVR